MLVVVDGSPLIQWGLVALGPRVRPSSLSTMIFAGTGGMPAVAPHELV